VPSYLPLALAAAAEWKQHRLYLALDTTVLWNRYCMVSYPVVCCGRTCPLMAGVGTHGSATVAFEEYQGMLRKARWLLRDRRYHAACRPGFCQSCLDAVVEAQWVALTLRLPCDGQRGPVAIQRLLTLFIHRLEARFYKVVREETSPATHHCNVGLWQDGVHRSHPE